MKKFLVVIGVLFDRSSYRLARPPKADYQWTGTVLEADGDHLVVEKGKDKWEFAYDKDTKVTGTLKVGAKVTVKYVMKATSIEAKEEPAKKATKNSNRLQNETNWRLHFVIGAANHPIPFCNFFRFLYLLPNTSLRRSVVRAVGFFRIFVSSWPTIWNNPSSALATT